MSYGEEYESKKSVFNAGIAATERIDALQRSLNAARFNLKMFNMETGTFNYEIMISSLNGLFHEAWAKLDPEEKVEGETIYSLIRSCMRIFPPIKQSKMDNTKYIDENNWEKLERLLIIYERTIKEYLDKHNLNAPNQEEEGYF